MRAKRISLAGISPLPLLGGAGRFLRDCIYPPACCHCGVRTHDHGSLCAACWSTIRFIERPYCEVLGSPFAYDPGPGAVSPEAIADPPVFDRLRSVTIHNDVARALVHRLKYQDRPDLAPIMAGWMVRAASAELEACDAVVAVPLHRLRLIGRRFNQSAELARHVAHLSGRPFRAGAILRIRRTSQQVGLSANARAVNVRGAFAVPATEHGAIFGAKLVLIDDVYTTGATVSAATRALKRAGAAEVTVLTFARAVSGLI
ncbi:ComF family protein [Rhizobium halophytocola]|uniref:ComF family protein n=1 Tax=Rhizobium halophytocola TaxID=735519 RepID=A0ABS4E2C1_9HYPH|nr:ComF family protein [Rhizobium halophytocola]MBP1852066.1 ComF family protein [Rhizobium halophytocola]